MIRRPNRLGAVLFGAIAAAGFVTYLVLGRHLWFYSDEWDYVVDRRVSDPATLFRAHNGQWQTLPILVYRALLHVTGLRTYLPYLVLMVLVYLVTCALLYVLMLRAGVRGPIAALVAGAGVFLGFAAENIVFAAQLTYFGSLAFGLSALLVATGRPTRARTAWVIVLNLAALLCSNLGVVTAVVVAAETLLRHGWRRAAVVTAPAAVAFVVWWLVDGSSANTAGLSGIADFVWVGLHAAGRDFTRRGNLGFVAVVLVLAVGLVCARVYRRDNLAIVGPLVLGAVVFLAVTGSQRVAGFGVASAASARYAGVVVVLLLPVAGVAANAIWNAFRPAGVLAVLVLLMGVPGNISALSDVGARADHIQAVRSLILAVPKLPQAATVPGDLRPFPESVLAPMLTVGYLREAAAAGDLPASGPPSAADRVSDEFRLALYQTSTAGSFSGCRVLREPVRVQVRPGSVLHLAGGFVRVVDETPGPAHGQHLYYNPNRGDTIKVLAGEHTLRLSSYGINGPARLCR